MSVAQRPSSQEEYRRIHQEIKDLEAIIKDCNINRRGAHRGNGVYHYMSMEMHDMARQKYPEFFVAKPVEQGYKLAEKRLEELYGQLGFDFSPSASSMEKIDTNKHYCGGESEHIQEEHEKGFYARVVPGGDYTTTEHDFMVRLKGGSINGASYVGSGRAASKYEYESEMNSENGAEQRQKRVDETRALLILIRKHPEVVKYVSKYSFAAHYVEIVDAYVAGVTANARNGKMILNGEFLDDKTAYLADMQTLIQTKVKEIEKENLRLQGRESGHETAKKLIEGLTNEGQELGGE